MGMGAGLSPGARRSQDYMDGELFWKRPNDLVADVDLSGTQALDDDALGGFQDGVVEWKLGEGTGRKTEVESERESEEMCFSLFLCLLFLLGSWE